MDFMVSIQPGDDLLADVATFVKVNGANQAGFQRVVGVAHFGAVAGLAAGDAEGFGGGGAEMQRAGNHQMGLATLGGSFNPIRICGE